jgi:hypothetical protein
MKEIARSEQIRPHEGWLLRIDTFPWDGVYRTLVGFAIIPAMSRLHIDDHSAWVLLTFLLGALLALRLAPAVVRKLVPFSETMRRAWAERRQLAKRYDSYQWRKLFWIGIGLASYTVISSQFLASRVIVSSICLLSGALGVARWRVMVRRIGATTV